VDGVALVGVELRAEARRIDDLFALFRRHLAEVEDGTGHEAAAIGRRRGESLGGAAVLLDLRRSHALEDFVALQGAVTHLRFHAVEPVELVENVLLGLWRQFAKAGLILQSLTLRSWGEALMALHPLLEVFLILGCPAAAVGSGPDFGAGFGTNLGTGWGGAILFGTLSP
jgi:hypothetical protein